MATVTKRAVAVANWDNRLPIPSNVAAQIQLALSAGPYACLDCTVSTLVQATMTAPNAGSNSVVCELQVPAGTSNAILQALVTAALNGLNLPFAAITVNSVTIF